MATQPTTPWPGMLALLLAVALSFWLAPAPRGVPDQEYWGEYVQVGPGLGFVLNHDTDSYLGASQHPGRLLQAGEMRQSRPVYVLLAAAGGYPLTAALHAGGRLGLLPAWPPARAARYGYYAAYVLLNALALLGALALLRHLVGVYAGSGAGWLYWPLAWVLLATPVTKAFFWTAHQQMLAAFVPLLCVALAWARARRPVAGWGRLAAVSFGLGWLPLAYGSFALAWPALALGQALAARPWLATGRPARAAWVRLAGQLLLSAGLFALPTGLWVGLLRLHGTAYYNHEAAHYHELVWLWEARHLPPAAYLHLVRYRLAEYADTIGLVGWWLAAGLGLLLAPWARQPGPPRLALPPGPGLVLLAAFGGFLAFFGLLGFYPSRLTYTLLPLVLLLAAGLLPHWPRRYARPLLLAVAAGWHLYVLLSYGPFS